MIESITLIALMALVWFAPIGNKPKSISKEEKAISKMWNMNELT